MSSRTCELDTDESLNKLHHYLDSLVEDTSTTQAYEASTTSSSAGSPNGVPEVSARQNGTEPMRYVKPATFLKLHRPCHFD
jgi:hypothetical protein